MRVRHALTGVGLYAGLLALGLLAVGERCACAAGVQVQIRYGFDGVARPDYWSPVAVELTNDGPEEEGLLLLTPLDRRLAARCEVHACFARIPQGSHQRYELFWPPSDAYGVRPAAVLGDATSKEAVVSRVDETQTLLVAVGFTPGTLQYLSRCTRSRLTYQQPPASTTGMPTPPGNPGQVVPVHLPPQNAPESALAYRQVDLLVLGPLFASQLSPAAQAAITSWVRTGGNLVITGGADAARLRHPFFSALLPVEGLSVSSLSLASGLSAYGAPITEPGAVVMGAPKPGAEVVAQESGVPIVVRRRVGTGMVTFFAFDPSQPPLAKWNGLEKLWLSMFDDKARLFSLGDALSDVHRDYYRPPSRLRTSLLGRVTGIKQVQAPPLTAIVGFLVIYFLLVVPINHWVLARVKRRELAWVTTPVIVAVFVVGAYGFGYTVKGPRLLIKQATILEAGEDSAQALALSYFGVFSPARRSYDIRIGLPGAVVTETDPSVYGTSSPSRQGAGIVRDEPEPWVQGVRIPMWGMKTYVTHGLVDMGGSVRARLHDTARAATPPTPVIAGWIENGTPWGLRDAVLALPTGTDVVRLGDVGPGEKVVVERVGTKSYLGRQGAIVRTAVQQLMAPSAHPTEVALVGKIERPPITVDLGRACDYDSESVILVRLPLE